MLIGSLADLEQLGSIIAKVLPACANPPLFLVGDLGSGKTALAARICKYWPGSEKAEAASPSFTHCNLYPGRPPIAHCDLYRSRAMPDEIGEMLDSGQYQLIIEWAEFMPAWIPDHLDIFFNVVNDSRHLELEAAGDRALAALGQIRAGMDRKRV